MKILLIGARGQLGLELSRSLTLAGEVVSVDRRQLDLANDAQIRDVIAAANPHVIVNAAAYTAVDLAESEVELSQKINSMAPAVMAQEAKRLGALLIHYSTDYVYSGNKTDAYTEDDVAEPVNAYGMSKLLGDQAIVASGCDHLILRSTWLYSAVGKNFFTTILRLSRDRAVLKVVNDQIGAPTWVKHLGDATFHLVMAAQQERREGKFTSGIFNLTAGGQAAWSEFAAEIVSSPLAKSLGVDCRIEPIPSKEYPTPATRPNNSVLDNSKFVARWGFALPNWREAFSQCAAEVEGIHQMIPSPSKTQANQEAKA